MPPKQTPATRAKIAASMRHGRANKVPFSGKLDPDLMAIFKRTAKARGMNLNAAWDAAARTWCVATESKVKPIDWSAKPIRPKEHKAQVDALLKKQTLKIAREMKRPTKKAV